MTTPLQIAAGEIGYEAASDPESGSKYGRWMSAATSQPWLSGPSTSVWWCMIFVSYCYAKSGWSFSGAPAFNTDSVIAAATRAGTLRPHTADAQPNDLVIFNWDGGPTDHVGIVELNKGTYLQTIEGNTSNGTAGSQSAGNGVWRRTRPLSFVAAIIRPTTQGENMTAAETWSYPIGAEGTSGKNNQPAWIRLSWIHNDTARLVNRLLRTDDAGTGDKTNGDLYTRVVYIDKRVREMTAVLTAQAAAIEALSTAMGADPAAISASIQNAVTQKLDSLTISLTTETKEKE